MTTTAVTASVTADEVRGQKLYTWTGIGTNGATLGDPVDAVGQRAVVQLPDATNINGRTVTLEGTNELVPTNYTTLKDEGGNAVSFTAAGIFVISMLPKWVRSKTTGSTSSTGVALVLATQKIF